MHTFQLPLYLKTKFALSPTVKIYLMGGGFATYALKADMFEKLSLAGEVPLKLKWSLYEPNVRILIRMKAMCICSNAGTPAWQPKRALKSGTALPPVSGSVRYSTIWPHMVSSRAAAQ